MPCIPLARSTYNPAYEFAFSLRNAGSQAHWQSHSITHLLVWSADNRTAPTCQSHHGSCWARRRRGLGGHASGGPPGDGYGSPQCGADLQKHLPPFYGQPLICTLPSSLERCAPLEPLLFKVPTRNLRHTLPPPDPLMLPYCTVCMLESWMSIYLHAFSLQSVFACQIKVFACCTWCCCCATLRYCCAVVRLYCAVLWVTERLTAAVS